MKRIFRPINPVLSFFAVLLLTSTCKKAPVNEVKINDFASLSAEFKTPSAEYTTAPFFVWNYKITKEDIDKYLEDFKAQGSSQVFIHPRPGLVTEYLSDEWFDLFRHAVEKGKELGMKIWIYDENSYPSGFAGGHVPAEMPESYNQGQGLNMTRFETLPDTAGRYYLCIKEENGNYTDITHNLESEKGKQGNYLLFSKTYNGKSDWYGGFSYVDLLYPGVTQKFIELTMTGYEKCAGQNFGLTVPGVFTDEPQINSPGGIRWTPDLFEVFQQKWHYDLKTNLPSLFEEVGDWKKVRHNYTQTLLQLFIDRWAKPYYEYCESKGLKFTGHYWEHEWPNMRPGGDNMAMYAWHQQPSIDMLFNQFEDSTPRAQFGNVRSVKELASAANQTGRQRKLSETYGGSGWDLTFRDMKRNGDWEYALGVNLMNQHLTYFTMAGARKYDYPPTFDYHEPWWNDYKYINDHYARLSLALSSGSQVNDILVIEPTTSAWLYDSYTKRNPRSQEIGQAFQTFVTTLEKNQVEYDLGSENIIKNLGSVRNGKLVVGQRSYSRVVLPPMMENLDLSTYKLLEKFTANGGILIAFSVPVLVDGSQSEGLKDMFVKYSGKIKTVDRLTKEFISEELKNQDLAFEDVSGGTLYHHRRILNDGQLIFLVNSDLASDLKGKFNVRGNGAMELNTLSGEISGYPNTVNEGKVTCEFNITPAGSLLLFIPDSKPGIAGVTSQNPELKPVETSSPPVITRDHENALTVDFCDVTVGGETAKDLHTYNAADKVYKYYGFQNGNPWNTSVQFKRNIIDRDTFGVSTGFTAVYHFIVKDNFEYSSFRAVVERPDLWKVAVNGTEVKPEEGKWWTDRNFSIFNIGKLVRKGDNSITLTASPMKIHAEIEPVYITGEFSVRPADKGFVIQAPVKSLTMGSWRDQGLPFYSWGVSYTREFNIEKPEGQYFVSMKDWKGTVAEVKVNDKPATVIAFPPYQTDVTALLRPGSNIIEVKVIGSLKNLMGPHHNNPAPGLASPRNWRNVKAYSSGKEYQQLDYGLYTEFELLNGK
ncbi:MAG: glycosyl hydrolase [Bacteroidota bacterium]|nr:glycosyl hydrolase [Bacteroidota bacterium]